MEMVQNALFVKEKHLAGSDPRADGK